MFLEEQISILEWFMKDHVTLKTGEMMLKIHHISQEKKYILKYNSYFKLNWNIANEMYSGYSFKIQNGFQ